MNQGKLEVVKQEMARVNANILGISELKWTGIGEFNSDDLYIYYCEQESVRRNGVAIIVNQRVRNTIFGCNFKNDRMKSVCFQGKPFNIMVIQVYAPTSNAKEAEVKWFCEDIQDLLELTKLTKKMSFHYRSGDLVTQWCLTLATLWTVAHQGPLSMGFSKQEHGSGLPFPSPHYRGLECKSRKSRNTWSNRQIWQWNTE